MGNHLRKRRLDLGILQKDVAQKIGVNKATITNWELNHNFPKLRYIPVIIEFLGYWPIDTQTENLGQKIVAARSKLGLSQKKLAFRLGVDPSTLRRWEHNIGQPLLKHRERVMHSCLVKCWMKMGSDVDPGILRLVQSTSACSSRMEKCFSSLLSK